MEMWSFEAPSGRLQPLRPSPARAKSTGSGPEGTATRCDADRRSPAGGSGPGFDAAAPRRGEVAVRAQHRPRIAQFGCHRLEADRLPAGPCLGALLPQVRHRARGRSRQASRGSGNGSSGPLSPAGFPSVQAIRRKRGDSPAAVPCRPRTLARARSCGHARTGRRPTPRLLQARVSGDGPLREGEFTVRVARYAGGEEAVRLPVLLPPRQAPVRDRLLGEQPGAGCGRRTRHAYGPAGRSERENAPVAP